MTGIAAEAAEGNKNKFNNEINYPTLHLSRLVTRAY
jgi:hypothetical protein